jgi:integrase
MPLSDVKVKNAKPGEKSRKISDGDGMYLLVTPAGGKCWRLKYRIGGKEKTLSMGMYPEVALIEARDMAQAARKLLAKGLDPGEAKKSHRLAVTVATANTFELVALEWHKEFKSTWNDEHAERLLARMKNHLFPWIGSRPIGEIRAPELLAVLQRVKKGSLEVAHRVRILCNQIFRYAVTSGRIEYNPVPDLQGALPSPEAKHYAAPTDPKKVGPLMRMLDEYDGHIVTQFALQLAPLTFVRPGELRSGEWKEIDFDSAEWNIPGEKMKMGVSHLIPLSAQAIEILKRLQAITGNGRFLFPSIRSKERCMSENTVNAALRRLGIAADELTGHGFRATARTILDEVLEFRPDIIEHQLAHTVKDPNGRAYNRTAHLDVRRKMMQTWADYLDGLKENTHL